MGVKVLYERQPHLKPVAYACDTCGSIWDNDRDAAWCCGPVSCETCGRVIQRPSSNDYAGLCWECRKKQLCEKDEAVDLKQFEKAQKVTWADKTEVVFFPDRAVGNDGFWYDDEPPEGHRYAWPCDRENVEIEASEVAESMLDNFEDGPLEELDDIAIHELQVLLDAWIAKHLSHVVAYTPNRKRCILLPTETN